MARKAAAFFFRLGQSHHEVHMQLVFKKAWWKVHIWRKLCRDSLTEEARSNRARAMGIVLL